MHRLIQIIQPFAEHLGGMGLALVAFLDSSFLSLPEVADILIVVLVTRHPDLWWFYAATTTVGSLLGCYVLFALARKGGEAFLRRRFREKHIDRGLALFRRWGLLAVIVPSILPPPMPYKIFVLLAGVAGVGPGTFILAVAIGRGFRYGGEALLAYWYGDAASQFIQDNLAAVSIWAAAIALVIGVVIALRRRARAA